ncbi:MAG TPA: hypothetical protein VMW27_27320 [Thermoanaerobaculia bacterium]|nr:hypothetical protein [Thermoanaerobaculia bacterium]
MSDERKRKKKSGPPEVFLDFEQACRESFGFLEEDYGFERGPLEVYGYEGSILFQSPGVAFRVLYEQGSGGPWVLISARVGEVLAEAGLHHLIAKRCPERAVPPARGLLPDAEVRELLRRYAEALKDCGQDLLRGDASSLPSLSDN